MSDSIQRIMSKSDFVDAMKKDMKKKHNARMKAAIDLSYVQANAMSKVRRGINRPKLNSYHNSKY